MQDGIIAGNGNSRYLKTVAAALSLYPDYESFMAALIAGTFPIDLNGINAGGWTQQGTPLNKASLFSDSTASALGLNESNTPNDALAKIKTLIDGANANANGRARIKSGTYVGTGTNSSVISIGVNTNLIVIGRTDKANPDSGFGVATKTFKLAYQDNDPLIVLSGTSVTVYNSNYSSYNYNENSKTYGYIAIY